MLCERARRGGSNGEAPAATLVRQSDLMRSVSATDAARRFADVLDAVERDGETFLIVRRGRPVARLGPAIGGRGSDVKALLRSAPSDPAWVEGIRQIRAALRVENRDWTA